MYHFKQATVSLVYVRKDLLLFTLIDYLKILEYLRLEKQVSTDLFWYVYSNKILAKARAATLTPAKATLEAPL